MTILQVFTSLVLITFTYIIIFIIKKHKTIQKFKSSPGIYSIPFQTLFTANALVHAKPNEKVDIILNYRVKAAEQDKKKGAFVCIFNPYIPILSVQLYHVFDVNQVHELTSSKYLKFTAKGRAYRMAEALLGSHSLLTAPENSWKTHRRLIEKGFNLSSLKSSFPIIKQCVLDMFYRWENEYKGNPFDCVPEMTRMTFNVIAKTGFGFDPDKVKLEDGKPPAQSFFNLSSFVGENFIYPPFIVNLPLKRSIKYRKDRNLFNNFVQKVLDEDSTVVSPGTNQIFLHEMKSASEMKPEEIFDNIKTLLFAGHDTTSNALSWAIYHLCIDHKLVDNLIDEFKHHFPEATYEQIDFETLNKLRYLDGFCREVLRLHPSANFAKEVIQDFTLSDGTTFYKGLQIMFSPHLLHLNPDYFKDPDLLLPERWYPENESMRKHEAFIPFSTGPRNCVGMKLAYLEMKTALYLLLNKYELQLMGPREVKTVMYTTLSPEPIIISVSARK